MKNQFLKLEEVQKNISKFEELSKNELKEVKGGFPVIIKIPEIIGIPAPILDPIQIDPIQIDPIDIGQIEIPGVNM
jgi:bacteriocin-like protein